MKPGATTTCRTCKRPLPREAADRRYGPFCSDRCRMADLGSWLSGSYRIESSLKDEDLDQGLSVEGEGDFTPRPN